MYGIASLWRVFDTALDTGQKTSLKSRWLLPDLKSDSREAEIWAHEKLAPGEDVTCLNCQYRWFFCRWSFNSHIQRGANKSSTNKQHLSVMGTGRKIRSSNRPRTELWGASLRWKTIFNSNSHRTVSQEVHHLPSKFWGYGEWFKFSQD